jgi:hypothetical protein
MLATMYWPLVTRVLLKGDGHDISWGCKIVTCQYMSYNSYPNCKHDISTWYIVYYFPRTGFWCPCLYDFFWPYIPGESQPFYGDISGSKIGNPKWSSKVKLVVFEKGNTENGEWKGLPLGTSIFFVDHVLQLSTLSLRDAGSIISVPKSFRSISINLGTLW